MFTDKHILLLSTCIQKNVDESGNTTTSLSVGLTENETKGVSAVVNSYGGICIQNLGFDIKNGVRKTYFEIEMSRSATLEEYLKIIEMPASNIAYIFYSHLNSEEKNKYSFIRVTIKFKAGGKKECNYPIEKLEILSKKVDLVKLASDLMGKEDYNRLFELFDKSAMPGLTVEQIKNSCKDIDDKFGKVDSVQFEGFSFFKAPQKQDKEFLHLAGVQYRRGVKNPLSIFMDPNTETIENTINTLKYKF